MALEFANDSLEVEDDNPDALLVKSKILFNMGLLDESIETLDLLLAICPNSVEALMVKSFVLLDKEDYPEAEECLDKVLKLDPDNEDALEIKEGLQKRQ